MTLTFEQTLAIPLRFFARPALAYFLQRALDSRYETIEPLFENVVGRPALERIDRGPLAEEAGDDDERRIGSALAGQLQRGKAVEGRQKIVREDDVERTLIERGGERLSRFDGDDVDGQACMGEHGAGELDVGAIVFEKQDLELRDCGVAHGC